MKVKADRYQKLISWAPIDFLYIHQVWRWSDKIYSNAKGFVDFDVLNLWGPHHNHFNLVILNLWGPRHNHFNLIILNLWGSSSLFEDEHSKTKHSYMDYLSPKTSWPCWEVFDGIPLLKAFPHDTHGTYGETAEEHNFSTTPFCVLVEEKKIFAKCEGL